MMSTKKNPNHVIKRTACGLGFFTLVPVPAGKKIIEYVGPILTEEETTKMRGRYLMALGDDHYIDGSPRSNAARYINHSCEPNAKAYRTGVRVWIWSLRDIEAGEEITYDYGQEYFDDFIRPIGCKCAKCFQEISPPRRGDAERKD